MYNIDKRPIFEEMTRTLPVLAFIVDAQGEFREAIANDYTDDLLFEESSVTIGKSIFDLFPNEIAETFAENIDQALQTGVVQEFEYSLPIDGETRTFAGYMAPMDEDMDEPLVIWIAEDITEHRERKLELERHEVFLESIREEVLVTDTDFVITYESAAVPKLYGYEQGERVGDSILKYVHPDDTEKVRAHFESQLNGPTPTQPVEFRGRNKDGTWTWVESQARLLDDHPAVEGVVVTSRDISERIELREERQRKHDHLDRTERLGQIGGWEYMPDTETVQWTDGARRIFDVPNDFEPTLTEAIEFYHPSDRPLLEKAIEKCLESSVQYSLDVQVITDEGRQRWVHTSGDRIDEDGMTKLGGVIQDITKRKTKEQQLNVLNRVLRHNLRNELNAVQGYTELLEEQLPAEAQDQLAKIVASADRLLTLAEKSKRFNKAIEHDYTTGPVDLAPLLDDLCTEYREKYPDATIQTELRDVQVPGNESSIKILFDELLVNALKHNNVNQPVVKITVARSEAERVTVSVADNGPGLPETEQQVIQQGEESALLHSDGMGLWTTNWLVTNLSGGIQVTATEGEGTTITVTLPAAESQ